MAHKTRADKFSQRVKARKDPRGLAKETKPHTPKTAYKRDKSGWMRYVDEAND